MTIPFEYVINPRSVAIIGASDDMRKFGGRIIGYLLQHKYKGKIYPINSKRETVRGLGCYKSISEIPGAPDVVIMAIPPAAVVETIRECAEKKTGCAIIVTTGFAEMSEEEALDLAKNIWETINLVNLRENIEPTRERTKLILGMGTNHSVETIRLRMI